MRLIGLASPINKSLEPNWLRIWSHAVYFFGLLLAIRFVAATLFSSDHAFWAPLLLVVGSFALALHSFSSALFAFTLGTFVLAGFGLSMLGLGTSAASLAFCGLTLGTGARHLAKHLRREPERSNQGGTEIRFSRIPAEAHLYRTTVAVNVIATVFLVSIARQFWALRSDPNLARTFWHEPGYAFGSEYFFLSTGFAWWQGWTFFQFCREERVALLTWLKPVFLGWNAALVYFFVCQLLFRIPAPTVVGALIPPNASQAYNSPVEDFQAFGSLSVALFAASLGSWDWQLRGRGRWNVLWSLPLLVLVGFSFSRAAWLTTVIVVLGVAVLRLRFRWISTIGVGLAAVIVVINLFSEQDSWRKSSYLYRLSTLTRFESPTAKLSSRFSVYQRAIEMIRQKPVAGHGLGTFFRSSANYSLPGDPHGSIPEFAHNFLLQIAAELGVPITLWFASMIAWGFWLGCRSWEAPFPGRSRAESVAPAQILTLALAAYLLTQLTANSLNIYATNQFFFWFLLAGLFALPELGVQTGQPLIRKGESAG